MIKMQKKGFTLVELLVVVTIIGIISAVGMTAYSNSLAQARDAKRKGDVNTITAAYELAYNPQTRIYPVLTEQDFKNGKIPKDPKGEDYLGLLEESSDRYQICTILETTDEQYCKSSDDAIIAQADNNPPPTPPGSNPPAPGPNPAPPPPTGPVVPTTYKRVFVSDEYTSYQIGGLSGADDKCQLEADSENLGGTWKAWLASQSLTNSPTIANSIDLPYKLISGETVVQHPRDLISPISSDLNRPPRLLHAINKDEKGRIINGGAAWTNLRADGTTGFRYLSANVWSTKTDYDCNYWRGSSGRGALGMIDRVTEDWTEGAHSSRGPAGFNAACTEGHRLYCFEVQSSLYYVDEDRDGYGTGNILATCPSGKSCVLNNQDCYDSNANAKPGQTQYFSTQRGDGSFDYNCDNRTDKQYSYYAIKNNNMIVSRSNNCFNPNFDAYAVNATPGCGQALANCSANSYIFYQENNINLNGGTLYRSESTGEGDSCVVACSAPKTCAESHEGAGWDYLSCSYATSCR